MKINENWDLVRDVRLPDGTTTDDPKISGGVIVATAAELKAAYAKAGMVVCSRDDIHAVTQEAHTQGRIYAGGGEKLNPADEYERLHDFVYEWVNRVLLKEAP